MNHMGTSVLILTLNEEANLPGCLESVGWADDIVVFDSYSTDRTEEIARAAGARFFQRRFDDYAAQRNAALNDVDYKYPWVLMLDADERITPELAQEIRDVLSRSDNDVTLYRIGRKDMFFGRCLRHCGSVQVWFGRLGRLGHISVHRAIHEEYHTDGRVGYLQARFVHYPLNKGLDYWFERQNRYSYMEAAALIRETQDALPWRQILTRDPVMRRKALKQLAYRIPCRPLLVFGYVYLLRAGFLDGLAGLRYCILRSVYEYMIDLKVKEHRRRTKGLPL